jgi:hypothetical protein
LKNQIAPEAGGTPLPLSKRDAKAQFRAAKAISKSQGSWPTRHKIVTGLGLVVSGAVPTVAVKATAPAPAPAPAKKIRRADLCACGGCRRRRGAPACRSSDCEQHRNSNFTSRTAVPGATAVTVKTQVQLFDQSSQVILDQSGNRLSTDVTAGVYVNSSNSLTAIDPGNGIKGFIVFDIAKTAVPTQLILHDSAFSGIVKVSLK